jgi:hypothetical protein
MQFGRLRKLFLDKSNLRSEDKHPNSMGKSTSDKLRPLRSSFLIHVIEHNLEMNGNTLMQLELLGNIHDEDAPLHLDDE